MQIKFPFKLFFPLIALLLGIGLLFPYLFQQVIVWQKEFNQLLSTYLTQIKQEPASAGALLIGVSFLYGIFHALGPGHGKFIIGSYLATHQSQLKMSVKLSLSASLVQGIVAVLLTSIIVLVLQLSLSYFKLSQLWLERGALGLLLLLGVQWCYQGIKKLWNSRKPPKAIHIQRVLVNTGREKVGIRARAQSAVETIPHLHTEHCGCGHQHLPENTQIQQATDWKSKSLVVLSIGMRPCSGAIFVLFLSYMMDLYLWGVMATFAMALGTGIMLSAFALLVQYARNSAISLGKWYLSPRLNAHLDSLVKVVSGFIIIFFAITLIYGTTLPVRGGSVLLG